MHTRTGSFGIGFRRGKSQWQLDVRALSEFARQQGFAALDLNATNAAEISAVTRAGLTLGSVDLLHFADITHADPAKRKEILELNLSYIKACTAMGARIFFTIVGADPARPRGENYRIAVESFAPLAHAAADLGATIAVEGYPGAAPHLALLCTTPETCRAMLKDLPRGLSLNYDPSHLIRLGVDHLRFLKEFAGHVAHVHAKDTQLFPESVYEFGLYQPSAFTPPHGFGQQAWRYTVPGQGIAQWSEIFTTLTSCNYRGLVSVELEDENFNGTTEGEQAGLLKSLHFLSAV